jgi:hypothetical protein
MRNKQIHIIGGGTIQKIAPHLALSAPAYGSTALRLSELFWNLNSNVFEVENGHYMDVNLHLTKMAGGDAGETNRDIEDLVDKLIADPDTRVIIMNAALCDFDLTITNAWDMDGKSVTTPDGRLSSKHNYDAELTPSSKIINKIRKERKDIFLVGFKTTHNVSKQEMFGKGLSMMKRSSCNLVFVNDIGTRTNFIITPEEASYGLEMETRDDVLKELVQMTLLRSHLNFTRSTVINAEPVSWLDKRVPTVLRRVVNYCIKKGAYKEGPTGATVGHFAVKLDDRTFLTSRRKVNFNKMAEVGLVLVETDGDDSVIAYGSKPSVGGQSQRIVFAEHAGCDSIVHFHCPLKADYIDDIPVVSQREYECGSHECGINTSRGLKKFGNIWAVMLDKHGPNLVFDSKNTTEQEVIEFMENNFDLAKKTTGIE